MRKPKLKNRVYDAQYDFPDNEIKNAFFESVRGDYINDVTITYNVEKLDGFDHRNKVVDFFLSEGYKEGDEVKVHHWW